MLSYLETHKQSLIFQLVINKYMLVAGGLEKGYNTVFTGGDKLGKLSKILPHYENYSLVVDDSVLVD